MPRFFFLSPDHDATDRHQRALELNGAAVSYFFQYRASEVVAWSSAPRSGESDSGRFSIGFRREPSRVVIVLIEDALRDFVLGFFSDRQSKSAKREHQEAGESAVTGLP